ncbi:hypothetical protein [Methanobrevibacter sp.]|uniref:hypothetical protein n=1 Tax=Methanobrevibacter sp. TaxID=66852 RepID=UPI00388D347C
MEILNNTLVQLIIVILIFFVLTIVGKFIYGKIKNITDKHVNVNELLPEDEVHTLKQVFYLIMMALCVVNIFYSITVAETDLHYLMIFDILLSLYLAITLDMSSRKKYLIWLLLIPYGSLAYSLFGLSLVILIELIHILIFVYYGKIYFDKFMEYTNSHGLGITIIILFIIIFGGFFVAQYSEGANALDSLVIVSNEFTGNGYSVFGETIPGKLNSLLLVWGGYVISGASAATLTAAILTRHFKKQFAELKALIDEGDENNGN